MAIKQHDVINIVREPSTTRHDPEGDKQKAFYSRFEKHFDLVRVGYGMQNQKNIVTYFAPKLQLLLDENVRNMFLNYTANSTDENVQRMRSILMDTEALPLRISALVAKMKLTCERLRLPVFEYRTLTFLPENARNDGARVIYRMAIDGSKSNNPNVYELSEYIQPQHTLKKQ